MKVLIIEDEYSAVENLKHILNKIDSDIEVVQVLESVSETVEYLKNEPEIDLAFFDIHLGDGISFEIFSQVKFHFPIIFTTAYDNYAIQAFKVNSIDYLLKPILQDDLKLSIAKYKSLELNTKSAIDLNKLFHTLIPVSKKYKSSLLIRKKDSIFPIKVQDIAYLAIEHGVVKAFDVNGTIHIIDDNLDTLESQLDPNAFFRANRQFIIQKSCVESLKIYFNGKLVVITKPTHHEKIVVSRAKATLIKEWLSQEE